MAKELCGMARVCSGVVAERCVFTRERGGMAGEHAFLPAVRCGMAREDGGMEKAGCDEGAECDGTYGPWGCASPPGRTDQTGGQDRQSELRTHRLGEY